MKKTVLKSWVDMWIVITEFGDYKGPLL
uniref:Uncharacterized protein n=1 Tax=Rhizophora mucronata TaxID=61149 RepID=A0A2P2NJW3_RHIMU